MTGIITSLPPLIEQPPGNNSSNPAGLLGVTYTAAIPTLPQTWTGLQTFNPGSVQFAGSTSGDTFLNASAIASGTVALPSITGTDTLLANNNIATVTNKSIDGLTNTLTNIPTASLDPDLQALAALTGTGLSARTAADTWALRTITGTTAEITVTNGDGVAGAPALSLPAALTFTGKAITGGTFNSPALVTPALGTPASGVATNLTGTAAGLTAGNATLAATVTTNANMTGDVTSVGNATTIGANKVTRAMQAQGVARSVIGVTGNATANVADIQGTASQFLGVNSAGTALAFQTMSGDATMSGPAITIAANAVTNAKMATMAAWTFKGNATAGSAVPTDVTIAGLTNKASPAAADLVLVWDVAGSAWKNSTISSIGSAGSVSSIAGNTGAFTLGIGLTNAVNDIRTSLSNASNVLGADVALNNTALYFDGPSMAQGTSGTWFVVGTVTLFDSVNASIIVKLWDGTTVISTAVAQCNNTFVTVSISGIITNPAANIRLSCKNGGDTTGMMKFNGSGNSKDCSIWGIRIA